MIENRLFPRTRAACTLCNRATCAISATAAVALIVVNLQQFLQLRWTVLTWFSLPALVVSAGLCGWLSRGEKSRTETFVSRKDAKTPE
jgi:hypothetical protein